MNAKELDSFTRAYLECALWSSTDGDTPLDHDYDVRSIAPVSLDHMREQCAAFQSENAAMLGQAGDDSQNGHDFWLTRNGHGAGFWDRGYDTDVSQSLTDAAHACGEAYLYVGGDGLIHCA